MIGYCPGIQAWYNLWVEPDPTQATAAGVPTRLAFGLEEVWANDPTLAAADRARRLARRCVQGHRPLLRAATTCTLLNATNGPAGLPDGRAARCRPHHRTPTSTARCGSRTAGGGVTLCVGNDGGVYRQHVASGERRHALANADGWGDRRQRRPAHAAALRRRDGQGRHGLHGPAGQRRGQDRPRRRPRTRSTAATASSPRSTRTTRTSPTRSTRAATSRSPPTAARPGPTSSRPA